MSYDQSCWDLAQSFLEDGRRCHPGDIDALAQAIQDVCEDHCRMIEDQEQRSGGVEVYDEAAWKADTHRNP